MEKLGLYVDERDDVVMKPRLPYFSSADKAPRCLWASKNGPRAIEIERKPLNHGKPLQNATKSGKPLENTAVDASMFLCRRRRWCWRSA